MYIYFKIKGVKDRLMKKGNRKRINYLLFILYTELTLSTAQRRKFFADGQSYTKTDRPYFFCPMAAVIYGVIYRAM